MPARKFKRAKIPVLRTEIHLFSGLGDGLFGIDRGVRELEKLIDDMPYVADARMWRYRQWEKVSDDIIQRHLTQPQRDDPIVIFIGHSKGAQAAVNAAQRLEAFGIETDLLVGIDPTALLPGEPPMKVPASTREAMEFWSDRGLLNWPLRMRKKFPDGQFGGKFTYGSTPSPVRVVVPAGHIPVASHEVTRNRITARVRAILRDAERETEKEKSQ
jgi:hypothetical protein